MSRLKPCDVEVIDDVQESNFVMVEQLFGGVEFLLMQILHLFKLFIFHRMLILLNRNTNMLFTQRYNLLKTHYFPLLGRVSSVIHSNIPPCSERDCRLPDIELFPCLRTYSMSRSYFAGAIVMAPACLRSKSSLLSYAR